MRLTFTLLILFASLHLAKFLEVKTSSLPYTLRGTPVSTQCALTTEGAAAQLPPAWPEPGATGTPRRGVPVTFTRKCTILFTQKLKMQTQDSHLPTSMQSSFRHCAPPAPWKSPPHRRQENRKRGCYRLKVFTNKINSVLNTDLNE